MSPIPAGITISRVQEREPEGEPGPESDVVAKVVAEVGSEAADQSEPLSDAESEPVPDAGPESDAEPEPEPEVEVDLEPDASDADGASGICAQCGTRFEESDIFCAECGFVRPRRDPAPRPNDTVAYDPFPWGLPRSTESMPSHIHVPEIFPEPAAQAMTGLDAVAMSDVDLVDIEETRIVGRTARGDRFVLQFSTGESVTIFGTGMVGRHPIAEPGEYFDTFVTIVDPGKSVSKTHLEFGQENGNFWVSDRFSGNGTVVREPDARSKRCEPGNRYRITRGTRVEIGEQFFIVS